MALEERPGTWTYDPEAEGTYVYLRGPIPPGGAVRTVTADGAMVNFDLDEDGKVIGIEILAAWPGE
ncbi:MULTISPECIES: DUF2283 domain-containing protein [Streptosporangium]|uniref:Uncharacterized protein YuzE n=1 Tax=Streptosporangium brasiliense TaxID=47480 RepID=A0ABT9R1Q4_9ACTN|nr:DUF2283 domain-containing protein [Streptosporangium brasiliense]MDP9863156.1 uncharacterized protein YuzE [Streptosporangium brasiliense]